MYIVGFTDSHALDDALFNLQIVFDIEVQKADVGA